MASKQTISLHSGQILKYWRLAEYTQKYEYYERNADIWLNLLLEML
jgi:hypothetical protein